MAPQLMRLYCNGLPRIETWTAELQGAGLDIDVHPVWAPGANPHIMVPMSVRGYLAPLNFWKQSSMSDGWRPEHVPPQLGRNGLTLVWHGEDQLEAWELAAFWAAFGSLPRMGVGWLFTRDGLPLERPTPEEAYRKAREYAGRVTPRPHAAHNTPGLDYRSARARRYDDGVL